MDSSLHNTACRDDKDSSQNAVRYIIDAIESGKFVQIGMWGYSPEQIQSMIRGTPPTEHGEIHAKLECGKEMIQVIFNETYDNTAMMELVNYIRAYTWDLYKWQSEWIFEDGKYQWPKKSPDWGYGGNRKGYGGDYSDRVTIGEGCEDDRGYDSEDVVDDGVSVCEDGCDSDCDLNHHHHSDSART